MSLSQWSAYHISMTQVLWPPTILGVVAQCQGYRKKYVPKVCWLASEVAVKFPVSLPGEQWWVYMVQGKQWQRESSGINKPCKYTISSKAWGTLWTRKTKKGKSQKSGEEMWMIWTRPSHCSHKLIASGEACAEPTQEWAQQQSGVNKGGSRRHWTVS